MLKTVAGMLRTVALFLVALPVHAQTSRGAVAGTVSDPSGAVIRQARVTLLCGDTGAKLSIESNGLGFYRFDAVDLGTYQLQVAHPGFRTFHSTGFRIEANRTITIDPRLEVGAAENQLEVSAASSELLLRDSPLRGGSFGSREVRDLPLPLLNPISLARSLPGATEAAGSTVTSGVANTGGFSINGQRPRANNFMLDGTDNNEVWLTGEEQVFTIADAIAEVSVQTGNFGVEFGRGGGGVFNVITKSGTNDLHGTLLWRYQSQKFDSVSNLDRLNGIKPPVFVDNVFGFTAGGPVRKNRLFYFAGFQQENRHSTSNSLLQVPTAEAVARLTSLFPENPNLKLYLDELGSLRGSGAPFSISLGLDPRTGRDRGSVPFATAAFVFPALNDGPQALARIDQYVSDAHRLSWRFLYDSHLTLPMRNGSTLVSFPGFVGEQAYTHRNIAFAANDVLGPAHSNEFRVSYERPDGRFGLIWPGSVPDARILPAIMIANAAAPGLGSVGQYHSANVFLFQETQTRLTGRHAVRYGAEVVRQTVTQAPAANTLGTIGFTDANALGYSAFANFLDDFSGPSASMMKVFGAAPFHPDQFRQAYFFQDNWKAATSLALTLGLRYDSFGQPANHLPYPAFSGFDPSAFLVRHEVRPDNLDLGPSVGIAWSPERHSGWLGRLLGKRQTVWRAGYQVSYDNALFTQLLSAGPAISTPNAITIATNAPNTGRGSADWFEQLPVSGASPRISDAQNALDGHLRNPYTERWSFGFQREFVESFLIDLSYVGSESHRLTTRADWNPRGLSGARLHPDFGQVTVRTSEGNSSYHSFQAQLHRRFSRDIQLDASYTWSKAIDSTSDALGGNETQAPGTGNLTSVPVAQGGLTLDRALSDFDRSQRLTVAWMWSIPETRFHIWTFALAGWSLNGVATFQSGTPYTVGNGSDRNNDGFPEDRPDVGNPRAPLDTRAVIFPRCASGYQNPDTLGCVNPEQVHWIEGKDLPNAATVGRSTLHTDGTTNFDVSLSKSLQLGKTVRLELRCEAMNAFNHPQFVQVPQKNVNGTSAGRFLNRDFTDGGIRTLWVQAKVIF